MRVTVPGVRIPLLPHTLLLIWRFRLAARTHASHAWNTGSIPVGATIKENANLMVCIFYFLLSFFPVPIGAGGRAEGHEGDIGHEVYSIVLLGTIDDPDGIYVHFHIDVVHVLITVDGTYEVA